MLERARAELPPLPPPLSSGWRCAQRYEMYALRALAEDAWARTARRASTCSVTTLHEASMLIGQGTHTHTAIPHRSYRHPAGRSPRWATRSSGTMASGGGATPTQRGNDIRRWQRRRALGRTGAANNCGERCGSNELEGAEGAAAGGWATPSPCAAALPMTSAGGG